MAATITQLQQARAAYHDLMTGKSVKAFVDQNGERVEYSTASRDSLFSYIQSLEAELGVGLQAEVRRPARFIF